MWLHTPASPRVIPKVVDEISAGDIQEVFLLAIQGDGTATYPSKIRPQSSATEADVFGTLVSKIRDSGMAVHGWFCVNSLSKTLAEASPDRLAVNRLGQSVIESPAWGRQYWACPSNPDHRREVCSIVHEVLARYELDGVHLDYIRYPDRRALPYIAREFSATEFSKLRVKADYCYCANCLRLFSKTGEPVDRARLFNSKRWNEWRLQNVVETVRQIRAAAGSKKLSASVFATPRIAREYVSQDVAEFRKYLDFLVPMIYNTYYQKPITWIRQAVRQNKKAFGGTVLAGLGPVKFLSPADLGTAIKEAEAGGADGVSVFSYAQMTRDRWKAIR